MPTLTEPKMDIVKGDPTKSPFEGDYITQLALILPFPTPAGEDPEYAQFEVPTAESREFQRDFWLFNSTRQGKLEWQFATKTFKGGPAGFDIVRVWKEPYRPRKRKNGGDE